MPVIAIFYGIMIRMYFDDHNPPHFHADYQGFEGLFSTETGDLIQGADFPPKARRLVEDWAREHILELQDNWAKAKQQEALQRIPGADS